MEVLPSLNAFFNALSAVFLVAGFYNIKRRKVNLHKKFMILAFISSSLFLLGYLVYHYSVGTTHFTAGGVVRYIYFLILGSHTLIAVFVLPMAIVTLVLGLKGRFDRHPKVARWTFPLWLYVSVTGVLIYFMLYHFF